MVGYNYHLLVKKHAELTSLCAEGGYLHGTEIGTEIAKHLQPAIPEEREVKRQSWDELEAELDAKYLKEAKESRRIDLMWCKGLAVATLAGWAAIAKFNKLPENRQEEIITKADNFTRKVIVKGLEIAQADPMLIENLRSGRFPTRLEYEPEYQNNQPAALISDPEVNKAIATSRGR